MKPTKIFGANVDLRAGQDEFQSLPAIKGTIMLEGIGETPSFETEWVPSKEEIALLNAGQTLRLIVLGESHPPVTIIVKEAS